MGSSRATDTKQWAYVARTFLNGELHLACPMCRTEKIQVNEVPKTLEEFVKKEPLGDESVTTKLRIKPGETGLP